ncbi:MAG TPA: four helix bundle protein [Kiritimatiellia bacterium]|jgi:four helix bundle protein|nr:four helix bundle protein [Kiritimatiellia bacterium]HOU59942.1 four helix bundle protein [Kiritimatiellia bacterium]HQF20607.1 four helix bundle protein [Kiritimatiellia bacterium]
MKLTRFEDIEAWQIARKLCQAVHQIISKGEFAKQYALKDQIDRASGSIMDNIAEGFDGGSNSEFARFLGYSQRSCSEVKSQLYRALDRGLLTPTEFQQHIDLAAECHRRIGGLLKYLKSTASTRKSSCAMPYSS